MIGLHSDPFSHTAFISNVFAFRREDASRHRARSLREQHPPCFFGVLGRSCIIDGVLWTSLYFRVLTK